MKHTKTLMMISAISSFVLTSCTKSTDDLVAKKPHSVKIMSVKVYNVPDIDPNGYRWDAVGGDGLLSQDKSSNPDVVSGFGFEYESSKTFGSDVLYDAAPSSFNSGRLMTGIVANSIKYPHLDFEKDFGIVVFDIDGSNDVEIIGSKVIKLNTLIGSKNVTLTGFEDMNGNPCNVKVDIELEWSDWR